MASSPVKSTALFVTRLYRAPLGGGPSFTRELKHASLAIAEADGAGRAWAKKNNYRGYTSYASLDDLQWRDPTFAALADRLKPHALHFARDIDLDLAGHRLELADLWINVLEPGGHHGAHIHPTSVISGTTYVDLPAGAGAIKFEDPCLPLMMAAPPRKADSRAGNRAFEVLSPRVGEILLWESYLRHEVLENRASRPRISVSFNFRLASTGLARRDEDLS